MSKSMINSLYYGRLSAWERPANLSKEKKALNDEIDSERQYFLDKLSDEDGKRFIAFDNLLCKSSSSEEVDVYHLGFAHGALLMMEVMEMKEKI